MYSLRILFFTLPLYFSHVFSPFGVVIGEVYSFERQKVYLFFILLCIAFIECIIRFPDAIWNAVRKYANILTILLLLPIFATLYFNGTLDMNFLFGSYEKHHGYLFYVSILGFIILMIASPLEFLKKYLVWSIYSAVLVACIAIWERIWWVYDIYGRTQMISLYSWRSSSTLGNPNYVAGYLLPFIPIFIFCIKKTKEKMWYILLGLFSILAAIFVTGSYIAICIACLIFCWYNISFIFHGYPNSRKVFIFVICIVLVLFLWFFLIDPQKLLSFESRFILMQESLIMMLQSPISLITGFGSESIVTHFSWIRSALVSQYFPGSMIIDSSHNLIIDVLFQYWICPILIMGHLFYRYRFLAGNPFALSVLSILFFLSLNVVIVSHLVILILCIFIVKWDLYKNFPKNSKHILIR